ncbi:C45 family autoproteolytic acyltransferase/hydolase [Scopulibacillus cellulosilyticus]|uniref:C45 family autoproteolytic acyltransferase/hydrolase n=1 Tax=Scopulibacillus cellulosilyticus TaxID=2665665 RepID=A0ABW2PV74_9BACL
MEAFPFFCVSGTAINRGREIGELARNQIIHNIDFYQRYFMNSYGISWESATARAKEYIPWIEKYDQEIMDEIKGISEGSEQNLIDIVALNVRSEIINTDGCTSLAAVPQAARNNETLLGQNWDWNDGVKPGVIVLEIDQSPRPAILMATEAGIVGKIGMNSEGLGVCLNFLGTDDQTTMGVPVHIILRGILNSRTLSQATGQIGRLTRGTSANYLIAHREGEALNIEATPDDYDVLYSMNGWLIHTNHFIGPRHINIKDTARINFPDTHLRQGRASKLLSHANGQIDSETFKTILTDHIGHPDSICRHGELFPPDLGRPTVGSTVFSIIMNLSEGLMELSAGQPCSNPYKTYCFSANKKGELKK